eukprot:scaffold24321_cov119-Isochrysis_galbana.AAC.3
MVAERQRRSRREGCGAPRPHGARPYFRKYTPHTTHAHATCNLLSAVCCLASLVCARVLLCCSSRRLLAAAVGQLHGYD